MIKYYKCPNCKAIYKQKIRAGKIVYCYTCHRQDKRNNTPHYGCYEIDKHEYEVSLKKQLRVKVPVEITTLKDYM